MDRESILEKIKQADMVLVGLGEDFSGPPGPEGEWHYAAGKRRLEREGLSWLLPAWKEFCREKCADKGGRDGLDAALTGLAGLLREKNYFVVSESVDGRIFGAPWKEGRLVMPCGCAWRKQCSQGCGNVLEKTTEEEKAGLWAVLEELWAGGALTEPLLGVCPECGAPLIFNNVYAQNYNEGGYMDQWRLYTKWLQGTLNRRLFMLELGVGMCFPSVIRWPFEKIAFLNEKAFLCRVHERLYQMDEKLSGKGCGISWNVIDWLGRLC